jgi:hypothetical protein
MHKCSYSHALSGWVDEETGRWRLRSSRESIVMEEGRPHSRPDAIALFRLAEHADKACKAPCFSALRRRRQAKARWHGPSEPKPAGSVKGSALQSWPDSGMNRLHRIGGRWDEGVAGRLPVTLRPGILIAWSCHREALPWGADPVCPARHPGSLLREKQDRRAPITWIGIGWMEGSEPGCSFAGC